MIDEAKTKHQKIEKLIDVSRFNEIFSYFKRNLPIQLRSDFIDRLVHLEESYKYMLHYYVEGFHDDNIDNEINRIKSYLYFLNDASLRFSRLIDDPSFYFATKRFENVRKTTLNEKIENYRSSLDKINADDFPNQESLKENEEHLVALFNYVWTMFGSSIQDYDKLFQFINDEAIPEKGKAQIVSAILIGNIDFFDPLAFSLLLDIYEKDFSNLLSARSLTAIFILLLKHAKKITVNKELTERLSNLNDSLLTFPRLKEVIINLAKAKDTQRISTKMQDEVIPELMKLRPEILNKIKGFTESDEKNSFDSNPDWEEMLDESGIGEKLRELTDMQLEGADVMMLAFSNLKNFNFFNDIANWFLPFDKNHSQISLLNKDEIDSFSIMLSNDSSLCNSDKYSFAFSLERLPEAQKTFMKEKMEEQIQQLNEVMKDDKLKKRNPEFSAEINKYIRDIYRFFKLYRRKTEFDDPFQWNLNLNEIPVWNKRLMEEDFIVTLAEFYFRNKYYKEALNLFLSIEKRDEGNYRLWEKIGFCYQSLKDIDSALEWYRRAEFFNPDSKWLIKKMAYCNRVLNNFDKASEYYEKALKNEPENVHLIINAGHCHLENDDYKNALKYYYHADYLQPGNIATLRAIGWTELMNLNHEKSISVYNKILNELEGSSQDALNKGYAALSGGNLKNALSSFKDFLKKENNDIKQLEKTISEDKDSLKKIGIPQEEIRLIMEKLKYDLQG